MPIIPPFKENGLFVTDVAEKAQIFNDYFILQCTTIENGSEISQYIPGDLSMIGNFEIFGDKILNTILIQTKLMVGMRLQ